MFSTLTNSLLAFGGGLFLILAAYLRGRLAGAKSERQKQATEELAARDIADAVDHDVGALPPASAREELRRWAK